MITSMTGFGIAEGIINGQMVKVEMRTVNARFFDFSSRLPSVLFFLEDEMRKKVHQKIKRGKCSLGIYVNHKTNFPGKIKLDEKRLSSYISELKKYARKQGIKGNIEICDLLIFPDIFSVEYTNVHQGRCKKEIFALLDKALQGLLEMRRKEGAYLARALTALLKKIEVGTRVIEKKAKGEPVRIQKHLQERIQALGELSEENSRRLEDAVLFAADKCDVTEEIVRLNAHLASFRQKIRTGVQIGKTLDFITQEMHREINTIGSKTQHLQISERVIALKADIEKIREQVQNIE